MKKYLRLIPLTSIVFLSYFSFNLHAQSIEDFSYTGAFQPLDHTVQSEIQFNGYTNYWHDTYREWYRYGNLFKMSIPNVEKTLVQSRFDIAEELGLPGLTFQEGFINALVASPFEVLDQPSITSLNEAANKGNVLVLVSPVSETGKKLLQNIPSPDPWRGVLKSHQFGAKDLVDVHTCYLTNGGKKIFIIASKDPAARGRVQKHIKNTLELLEKYDMHRGWFGAQSLLKSVTCVEGHPLVTIGRGMNEGNSWFVFDGYMDFLAQQELIDWLAKVDLPVVADVGYGQVFGCDNYEGLQVQNMFTKESWINYAHEKGGYAFGPVYDPKANSFDFDGYIATEGHKEQIDNENMPFIIKTGSLAANAISSMVLFTKKGEPINKPLIWEAIMDRREVGILGNGKMMGPALYRHALQLLLLDRLLLEEYFGDRISIEASTEDYTLNVTLTNTYAHSVSGTLERVLPEELKITGELSTQINLPAKSSKTVRFEMKPSIMAMGQTNPIAVHYRWGTRKKSTLTLLDLPPVISVQQLLYGHSPNITYPVTIHNYSDESTFPVQIEVLDQNNSNKIIYSDSRSCSTSTATFKEMHFDLDVPPGSYMVKVTALGVENLSQLGVGSAATTAKLNVLDLDGDGIDEYRMENDSVQVTLLTTGGRVIEYIIKSRDDNALYKKWPLKPIDDKRAFRKRGYYPYGGFEDFLGQASMETHKVYTAETLKKEDGCVRVKMTADYFGNKLEKIYTLYGNSPLLEVRFALTFHNPEANMIAPVPVLDLGVKHWTEDVFTVPETDGLHEYRMQPERYFGRIIYLKEGWDAGYDTKEDISFVSAFPVKPPLFLHMFMNHPRNPDAHFYCHEFQPWVPIFQKSTMYFTFYMWGAAGPWQYGVKALRELNLITQQ